MSSEAQPKSQSAAGTEEPSEADSGEANNDEDDAAAIVAAKDGDDPGAGDVLLAALAEPQPEATGKPAPAATMTAPISGLIVEGSSGVLPPAVAEFLFSPLMVLELLVRALTEAGRAILLPALLLALATAPAVLRDWGAKPAPGA